MNVDQSLNLSNLAVFFREYAREIALTRSLFQPKMHQISFSTGPAGVAYSAPPDSLAGLRGHLVYHIYAVASQSTVKCGFTNASRPNV